MADPESSLAVQPAPFVKASTVLGHALGMETSMLIDTLKSQFFKNLKPEQVSDAQLATVIAIANALNLNPLLPGQLYPYPERSGGVTVMIGPDGIYTLLANNPDIVACKEGGGAWWTVHAIENGKETCTAFINHRTKGLLKKTIWVDEWVVSSNPNWNTRRHHMAEIRALKQCARQVVHGIPPDLDEKNLGDMLNVTTTDPDAETPKRDKAPDKAATGAAGATEEGKKTRGKAAKPAGEPGKVIEGDFHMTGAKAAEQVLGLSADEKRTLTCKVTEFTTAYLDSGGKTHPSVKVMLDGEFKGNAIHLGGATVKAAEGDQPEKLVANEAYQLEKPVTISLIGKARKPQMVDGKEVARPCAILVEAIAFAPVAPTAPAAAPAEQKAGNEQVD